MFFPALWPARLNAALAFLWQLSKSWFLAVNYGNSAVEYVDIIQHFRVMAMFEDCSVTEPESPCGDGDTPLHVAAMEGRLDWITIMLNKKK